MYIYVDESGSFVTSPQPDSWNVVAALVVPEAMRRNVSKALRRLKDAVGRLRSEEIKLKDVPEAELKRFLEDLGRFDATLFASCIDAGAHEQSEVAAHRTTQAAKLRVNIPRMVHPEGRQMVEDLASRTEQLSDQLYIQMIVQLELLDQVFRAATLYYVQRDPIALGAFVWQIDEKNSSRPNFETTMRHLAPPILQAKSMAQPVIFIEDANYAPFERAFRFEPGKEPAYQGLPDIGNTSPSHLSKILEDFEFVDSQKVEGVQIADLLASTLRRLLRGEFEDSEGIASALGRLTVQAQTPRQSIQLVSIGRDALAPGAAWDAVQTMDDSARQMIQRRRS